jgi:hypothetical protein
MLAFLIRKYSKSGQVLIKKISVFGYAHDSSYFKSVFDSKREMKPDFGFFKGTFLMI